MVEERLIPRSIGADREVVLRHIERYLTAVRLIERQRFGGKCLDFGCGIGYGAAILTNFFDKVTGYDISQKAIKYAEKIYNIRGLEFVSTIDKEADFDVVISLEVIEHVGRNECAKLLKQMAVLCKHKGAICISTPLQEHSTSNPINPNHKYEYSISDIISEINTAGLEIKRIKTENVVFTTGECGTQGFFVLGIL